MVSICFQAKLGLNPYIFNYHWMVTGGANHSLQ